MKLRKKRMQFDYNDGVRRMESISGVYFDFADFIHPEVSRTRGINCSNRILTNIDFRVHNIIAVERESGDFYRWRWGK